MITNTYCQVNRKLFSEKSIGMEVDITNTTHGAKQPKNRACQKAKWHSQYSYSSVLHCLN